MQVVHPDIVVVSPDGEYLIIVEVKSSDRDARHQNAIRQLRHLMASTGCSVGFVVFNEHISLLRDSLEKFNGESISVVGEAKLPTSLLPPSDEHRRAEYDSEFESRVQRWLETLKLTSNIEKLPEDLKALFREPVISLLQLGEIRAAHPRWSQVAN